MRVIILPVHVTGSFKMKAASIAAAAVKTIGLNRVAPTSNIASPWKIAP